MAHRHRHYGTVAGDLTAQQQAAAQEAATLSQQLGIHAASLPGIPPGTPPSAAAAMAGARKQVADGKSHKPSFLSKKIVGPVTVLEAIIGAAVVGGGTFLYLHYKHKR